MDDVARMPSGDRADLYNLAAQQSGLPPDVVEKDFWVCWILKRIFSLQGFEGAFTFPGAAIPTANSVGGGVSVLPRRENAIIFTATQRTVEVGRLSGPTPGFRGWRAAPQRSSVGSAAPPAAA